MKIRAGDVEFSYQEAGSGLPILFVHGFPLHGGMWHHQLDSFSKKYHAIAPDIRGFGNSIALSGSQSSASIDVYADDLAAFLQEKKLGPVIFVGLSMGGYIGFSFFQRHRSLLKGLVLVDTKAAADSPEGKEGRFRTAQLVEKGQDIIEGLLLRILGKTTISSRPNVVSLTRKMMKEAPSESVINALYAMAGRKDSSALLGAIDLPTLVLVGSEDELTPPKEAQEMAENISGASYRKIPDAGHLSNLETPKAFDEELFSFIDKIMKHDK